MTYNKLNILFVLLAVLIMNSCCNSTKYDLIIDKEPYFGNELRIDGYYYSQYEGTGNDKIGNVLFFYRNGTVLHGSSFSPRNFEMLEKFYLDGEYEAFIGEKDVWSTFKVRSDSLVFERWNPPTMSKGPEPILYFSEILNDTTFVVYQCKLYSEQELYEKNETYHFRKFDHKPDSTNNFTM